MKKGSLTPVMIDEHIVRNIYCPGEKRYTLATDFLSAFYVTHSSNGIPWDANVTFSGKYLFLTVNGKEYIIKWHTDATF